MKRRLTRRELIKYGMLGLGTLAAGGGGLYSLVSPRVRSARADEDVSRSPFTFTPFSVDLPIPPVVQPLTTTFTPQCDLFSGLNPSFSRPTLKTAKLYAIHMQKAVTQIIPGVNTEIWGYNGLYPGPTFRVMHGEPAIVRFFNDLGKDRQGLDIDTIVHNHGGHTSSQSDGSPVDPNRFIHPSNSKDFCYPNIAPFNPDGSEAISDFASTQWYHDHFHGMTGRNVYMGLAGFYLLRDDLEQSLITSGSTPRKLPADEFDIPLVFQDRAFAADGSLLFKPGGDNQGALGDVFVVNGKAQPRFHVQRRKYRFRILNGSDARWWEFRLTSGSFLQIGNDSWLLPFAIRRDSIRLGIAERADVIIDFRNAPAEVFLVNVLQQTEGAGPGGVRTPGTPILKFLVDQPLSGTPDATIAPNAPGDLSVTLRPNTPILASEIVRTRHFVFDGDPWVINDREFDPNRDDATPKINTAERWILTNDGGDWAHPIHIHLEGQQIQKFNGRTPALYNSFKKDTTPLLGDDEAEVFIKFRTFTGRYVFHCHNLQHEDDAMMAVLNVKP